MPTKIKSDDKKKSLIIYFKKHRWNIPSLNTLYTLLLVLYTQKISRKQEMKQIKEKSNL